MATHKLLLLPGDGIGPEVMAEVTRLIDWLNGEGITHFETEQGLVGGAAYDASKRSITDAPMAKADAADAVIFGAVGGPTWDSVPYDARPEAGLLRLRKELGPFADLRPAGEHPRPPDGPAPNTRGGGGRPIAAGKGPRPVRELTAGGVLSRARRCIEPEARGGRRPRHHDRARAHRWGVFRRTQNHHRSRQRPEARHRYASL